MNGWLEKKKKGVDVKVNIERWDFTCLIVVVLNTIDIVEYHNIKVVWDVVAVVDIVDRVDEGWPVHDCESVFHQMAFLCHLVMS